MIGGGQGGQAEASGLPNTLMVLAMTAMMIRMTTNDTAWIATSINLS